MVEPRHRTAAGDWGRAGIRVPLPQVRAKHECFFRLVHETPMSFPAVGRKMGGFDHTTVLWGVKQHAKRIEQEARAE